MQCKGHGFAWVCLCLLLAGPFFLVDNGPLSPSTDSLWVFLGLGLGVMGAGRMRQHPLCDSFAVALRVLGAFLTFLPLVITVFMQLPAMTRMAFWSTAIGVRISIGVYAVYKLLGPLLGVAALCLGMLFGWCDHDGEKADPKVSLEVFWQVCAAGFLARMTKLPLSWIAEEVRVGALGGVVLAVCSALACLLSLASLFAALHSTTCGGRAKECDDAPQRGLPFAYVAGAMSCVMVTRVVPVPGLGLWVYGLLSFAALAIVACGVLGLINRGAKKACDAAVEPTPTDPGATLARFGLAPRELEIATAYVQGETSTDIAERLGIKPATVRATMRRVYAKAGVANRDELAEKVLGIAASAASTEKDGGAVPSFNSWAPPVGLVQFALACDVVTLLPFNSFGVLAWGAARPLVYGCALGLLCVVACAPRLGGVSSGVREASLFVSPIPLLAAHVGVHFMPAAAFIVFLLAFVGGACVALWCVEKALRFASSCVAPCDAALSRHFPAAFFGFGVAWEESWRLGPWYSAWQESMAFLLICCLGSSYLLARRKGPAYAAPWALALVFAAMGIRPALVALSLCALAYVAWHALGEGLVGGRCVLWSLVALACGAFAGDFIVNSVGSYLVGNAVLTASFGGRKAFGMLAITCIWACALLLGALLVACAVRIHADGIVNAVGGADATSWERLGHALRARGLNETQAAVVTDIIAGKTSAEIASVRHLSRGAVNSARGSAYQLLGVHSRTELAEEFSQLLGL